MNISHKTVLITGGGTGIGLETARLLSARGNTVILVGRTGHILHEAAAELPGAVAIRCDITDPKQVRQLVAQVTAEHPTLSVLINNAGRAFSYRHGAGAGAAEKAHEEFATNYFALLRLTEGFLPLLKAQPEAAVVNVSSIVAYAPSVAAPSYSDSKAAVHSYTLALRHTLAQDTNVKVFEALPSLVNTAFSQEIGGAHGMPAAEVAEALVTGIEHDEWEIPIGQTAGFRAFFLSAPQQAFEMMQR
jgi:uncharacterized oxidoreductase